VGNFASSSLSIIKWALKRHGPKRKRNYKCFYRRGKKLKKNLFQKRNKAHQCKIQNTASQGTEKRAKHDPWPLDPKNILKRTHTKNRLWHTTAKNKPNTNKTKKKTKHRETLGDSESGHERAHRRTHLDATRMLRRKGHSGGEQSTKRKLAHFWWCEYGLRPLE